MRFKAHAYFRIWCLIKHHNDNIQLFYKFINPENDDNGRLVCDVTNKFRLFIFTEHDSLIYVLNYVLE